MDSTKTNYQYFHTKEVRSELCYNYGFNCFSELSSGFIEAVSESGKNHKYVLF